MVSLHEVVGRGEVVGIWEVGTDVVSLHEVVVGGEVVVEFEVIGGNGVDV